MMKNAFFLKPIGYNYDIEEIRKEYAERNINLLCVDKTMLESDKNKKRAALKYLMLCDYFVERVDAIRPTHIDELYEFTRSVATKLGYEMFDLNVVIENIQKREKDVAKINKSPFASILETSIAIRFYRTAMLPENKGKAAKEIMELMTINFDNNDKKIGDVKNEALAKMFINSFYGRGYFAACGKDICCCECPEVNTCPYRRST